jgi:hypothetical protein
MSHLIQICWYGFNHWAVRGEATIFPNYEPTREGSNFNHSTIFTGVGIKTVPEKEKES